MRIHQASGADAQLLAALHGDVFPEGKWDASFWNKTATDPNAITLFADERGRAIGLCALRRAADEAEILTIGVASDYRQGGMGRELLSEALSQLPSVVARVFLEVETTNVAALALYRSLDFAAVGERKDYYGPGRSAVVMERRIEGACPSD